MSTLVICIGPGANAHRMWQMRDADTAPDHMRVPMTFRTPVDHVSSLRTFPSAHSNLCP